MSRTETEDGGRLAVVTPEARAHSGSAGARDVPFIVGGNLRRLRKAHGLSLERLAELSGVSRAMLGQIETAKSVPTVSLLWRVADALGVPVATLVASESEPLAVVLSRSGASLLVGSEGRYASRSLLPHGRAASTGFFELHIAASHREACPAAPIGTRHSLVVAHGSLSVAIGDETPIALGEGDAIAFEGGTPYAVENPAASEAIAYLVVVSPTP
ncbi:XRE family transcriptional regulator [Hyphomicrobium sp.]|uniref:XRE family transcriptional regulator n=1 Tax=Hyphomicrobium sp. TaxID=82 RepID=UPI002C03BA90|nr:XRE family transcriptional regulator [Hyphomicrobium sp.]HRN87811.1 XRE family transcriptional regulator [Hyphomicrobium sp.]HRQ26940.1 XRE family transcriptional regulator [Hyphomicrobium sp.]